MLASSFIGEISSVCWYASSIPFKKKMPARYDLLVTHEYRRVPSRMSFSHLLWFSNILMSQVKFAEVECNHQLWKVGWEKGNSVERQNKMEDVHQATGPRSTCRRPFSPVTLRRYFCLLQRQIMSNSKSCLIKCNGVTCKSVSIFFSWREQPMQMARKT